MTEPARCPKCHAELSADAPQGLCPQCLLQAAFDSQSAAAAADPATDPTRLTSSGFVPPSPAALGRLFPQLEILELLGRGGMGAVYKARQKGLDRLVAVKVLPPEVGNDPAFAERFTREAKALARLNHPSIVTVHDVGQADGLYFFVMEFVDGLNLRQLIERRELSSEQALAIVPQICEALQYAHDEGIVHRDIKPENILLDKRGRVKIADFGLAKLLGHESVDGSLTGTQQVMGTLRYMAPEQMRGARQVDHRADIYSLGVVFYELLTGELPIGRFAPPSRKVQIDVRLDEIVLRALEAEPEQRYQHASDVKTEIDAIRTTPAQPRTSAERRDPPDRFREMARVAMTPTDLPQGTIAFLLLKLFLIAGVVLALTHVGQIVFWTQAHTGYVYESGVVKDVIAPDPANRPLNTFIWIDVLVASAVCFFVGRAAWRKIASETGTGPVSLSVDGVPLIRQQLKGPAIALMLYGLIVLFPAALCFTNGFDIADGNDATPAATGFGLMALSFLLLGVAGLIIRGGWHMLAVESYRAAFLASFLGQPIGLWGLFVLSRPDVKAAFPVASQFRSEPRFSRFAIAGAVWALFGLLAIVPILFFIGLNRVWSGTALPTDVIYAEPPLVFTIFMGALLAMSAGAPIGTTIFGALSIGHIKRSGGKIIGRPLAIADAIFFPLLLLAGMAGFVAMLTVLTAIQWGIDPRLFDKNDLPHLLIVVMAALIWFFPARALWRAVVGPRDALPLGKLPLVGNEPLTSKAALVLALAAIAAHAWPWHWIVSPPPSQRSMTISNFDVIDAWQSVWLLVLSIGLALFATAPTLAKSAKMILRIGSVIAALAALVIQVQFFRSLGEFEPERVEKVVRLTRTYSHMGVYVTMTLTSLAILFFVLRLFEEKSGRPDSQPLHASDDVQNSEPRLSRLALWGAIWGGLGLLGLIVAVFLTSLSTSGPSGQSSAPPESLRILALVIVSVAVALGVTGIFGTTICGAVAIGQIKHSDGKLYGLWLAAADSLLFPLLALGGIIAALVAQVVFAIAPHPNAAAVTSAGALGVLVALVVCFFVARAVWRAIVGQSDSARRGFLTPPLAATEGLPGATNAQETFGHSSGSVGDRPPHGTVGDQPQPANHLSGIGQISLWTAMAGVVLPVLLALGALLVAPSQRLSDFFVLGGVLGGLLELVALVCGIVAWRTGSGKAGTLIASVSLLLGLLIASTSLVSVSPSEVEEKTESLSRVPAAVPPLGNITSGIGAEFTVPAGQVAIFEIVTRRNGETVPVPPHCGYVMASPESDVAGTFRWSRKPVENSDRPDGRIWSLEILTGGGGRGYSEGTLLPEELNDAVGARGHGLGRLEPNEEVIHWGTDDANNLPANGLTGLRVTVVAHEFKSGGSGNAHIDWKQAQSATSTTRRKLPVDPSDSFHSAAEKGDAARVKQLLDAGASVNAKDADGQTPLMKAVAAGHKSLALTLIMLGADLTEQDARGRSALMIAAEKRDATLLSRLNDLSQISYDQDTTKRKERLRAFPGVERSLLAGRDVDLHNINLSAAERLQDNDGENALMKAARTGDWECFNILANQTDTLLAQDKLGRTVLMHAVLGGHAGESRWREQIEWLTKPPYIGVAGVDNIFIGLMYIFELERSLSLLDHEGKSVLQLAEEHDQKEIAGILRRHLGMIATNQTAEIEKGGDGVSKHHRLRGLAWRALGEKDKAEADLKLSSPK